MRMRWCMRVSSVCQLSLNIHRWDVCCWRQTNTMLPLWPASHTFTISFPASMFKRNAGATTPEDNTKQSWPKLAEAARLHRLRGNTNCKGLILDSLPYSCLYVLISGSLETECSRFTGLITATISGYGRHLVK